MPLIDHALEGAALLARQATATAASALASAAAATTGATASAATTNPDSSGFLGTATTTTNAASSGTAAAPPSATTTSGSGSGGGGGSSPLLFFVALGFGVVFTNLWIIVGVKYCFRYNARARQLRLAAEDGEPINLENMPHPRRRRREKKLMTIDEVNEKFPMIKYKAWVATRAAKGLSTEGGVNAPSRPNSVRSAEGIIAPVDETTSTNDVGKTRASEDSKDRPTTSIAEVGVASVVAPGTASTSAAAPHTPRTDRPDNGHDNERETATATADARASLVSADGDGDGDGDGGLGLYNKDPTDERYHHSDDDDDEHIDPALPPECVGTSGDTCAICIDTLEDDDDVRGLTCGHAFHAVCLDPWLTSRRACCPLCKADYYTPKPRAPPAEGADAANATMAGAAAGAAAPLAANSRNNRTNVPFRPGSSWRSALPGRFILGPRNAGIPDPAVAPAQVVAQDANASAGVISAVPSATRGNWISSLRPFRRRNGEPSRQGVQPAAAPAAEVSPSQLEAGVRSV